MSKLIAHLRAQWAGFLALFLVIAGGTAYAANTIGSSDIIDESIQSVDLKNGEVKTPDLVSGSVQTGKIANDQVFSEDVRDDTLRDGGLTAIDIADAPSGSDSVNADKLDGLSSKDFGRAGAARSVGPITVDDPVDGDPTRATLFTVGPVTVSSHCKDFGTTRDADILISSSIDDGAHFSALRTFGSGAAPDVFEGQMHIAGQLSAVGFINDSSMSKMGESLLTFVTSNGQARTANLYFGTNILGGECVFGYTLFAQ